MSPLATLYDSGTGSSIGESNLALLPKGYLRDGTRRGIVFCHGAGVTELYAIDQSSPNMAALLRAIVDAGYPVLASLCAGNNWGNDGGIAKVSAARTYLQGTLGAKSGKVILIGNSMGGCLSYAWARANLTSVACIVGILPVSDLNDIVTNNRGGLGAEASGAYSGGYSEATYGATHNPVNFAAQLSGLPIQAWSASDDTIVVPSTVTAFAAGVGSSVETHNTLTGGHSDSTYGQISAATVLTFLAAHA